MDSIYFAVKSLVITFLVVLVMQIKWEDQTIERKAYHFFKSSSVIAPLNSTANGIVVFIRNSWNRVTRSINSNFTNALRFENQPGSREASFGMSRSRQYQEDQKERSRSRGDGSSDVREVEGRVNTNSRIANSNVAGQAEASSTSALVEKFQSKFNSVKNNFQNKFIDESKQSQLGRSSEDKTAAKATEDEDMITEE